MERFKGTKGKYNAYSGWGVYHSRAIGVGELDEIVVMPNGNSNSNQEIAICFTKDRINKNGGLTIDEAKANARLISKSVDMLKAIITTVEELKEINALKNHTEYLERLIKECTEI